MSAGQRGSSPFHIRRRFQLSKEQGQQRLKALHDIGLGKVDFLLLSHGIFNTPLTMKEKQYLSDVHMAVMEAPYLSDAHMAVVEAPYLSDAHMSVVEAPYLSDVHMAVIYRSPLFE